MLLRVVNEGCFVVKTSIGETEVMVKNHSRPSINTCSMICRPNPNLPATKLLILHG